MKRAVELGVGPEWYPVGREIEDTWNGEDAPLIVAQYLDSTNNETYGGAIGVLVVRKYVDPLSQPFGKTVDYPSSTIFDFLQTTYYSNCSDELKENISPITVKCNGVEVTGRWHLLGGAEIGLTYGPTDGIFWEYWKEKTGLDAPQDTANSGRQVTARNGIGAYWWLRSRLIASSVITITGSGDRYYYPPTHTSGVVPFCFIGETPTE